MDSNPIRILFVSPECAPLVKTGGLGDVSASLPKALLQLGIDVKILLPGYSSVLEAVPHTNASARIPALDALPESRIFSATSPDGLPLLILHCPQFYERPAGPYLDANGHEWPDNPLRFGLLSRAAALLGTNSSPLDWRPQIVHCNDWQTGLAPAYLALGPQPRAASVFTIHNLAYQGIYPADLLGKLGLPGWSFTPEGLEYYGSLCFLKAALHYSDALTTVSPTYAREVQSEAFGFGMHGLLTRRAGDLTGILNGIDTEIWNPGSDPLIERRYDSNSLGAKIENKRHLQRTLALTPDDQLPLLGMVTRLASQKGIDLLIGAARSILNLPAQIVIQSVGDGALERELLTLAGENPGRMAVKIGFNEQLAHAIEAGADMFLMPSRFEPCGMNQMFSQRYGTPPIVRATGGLVDSVVDCNQQTLADGTATGFLFAENSAEAFLAAISRARSAYRDPATWRSLQQNGMRRDFSWSASASRYVDLYRYLITR